MKIEEAIQQPKFKDEYQKAHINLIYTASWINTQMNPIWKNFDLTAQQFNVLRILRGAKPNPVSVKEITEKMLDRSSNASRLVDKLLDKKLVERSISTNDRRRVEIIISKKGLAVINEVSVILEEKTQTIFKKISKGEAKEINRILDNLRG